MRTFRESLEASFEWNEDGFWSFRFDEYELTFEPLLFDEQHYVALYRRNVLILKEKIVVKPGKEVR